MIEDAASGKSAGILGIVGTGITALLPKLTCPVCWPAYTSVLSAFGVGFVDYTPYLLPLTVAFVAVSLVALALAGRARRNYVPLFAGAFAAAVLLLGRFLLDSEFVTYAGVGLLVIAPFLPVRIRRRASCERCGPMPEKEARS